QLELPQRSLDPRRVRAGDERIRAEHKHRLNLARLDFLEQLEGGDALARQLIRIHAPNLRDAAPRLWILDRAVTRQLIRLLTVLAAALTVRLAGDGAEAAVRPADLAAKQR